MKIACWQTIGRGADATLAELRVVAQRAVDVGAGLLIAPEMSLTGYHRGRQHRLRRLAEPVGGPLCQRAAKIADECGIALVYGWPEAADGAVYNSVLLIDRTGKNLATYRKTHLYGDIDRAVFVPGRQGVVQTELDGLTIGLLICYDVEFPEAVRSHALAGTQLLVVPTALTRPWEFVARTLLPTRAFESQLFVAYVNWVGRQQEVEYCGLSQVLGPDGKLLVGGQDIEQLLFADIDPMAISKARAATTYLQDLRPDLFPGPFTRLSDAPT
jgi:5-aminopentanamidase